MLCCYKYYGYLYSASLQEAIHRRSQRDRQVKRRVFKLRRDASDIPCGIKLRSAGEVSFQSVGPIAAKARFEPVNSLIKNDRQCVASWKVPRWLSSRMHGTQPADLYSFRSEE